MTRRPANRIQVAAWNHWIGSTVTFRPELRFERSYDQPAYNNGTKKNQLIFGGDVIFHF
jgi:hypothetical protein